ncbi:MAG: aromatic ring-hydroxylating dioxygenase subunit alpha [Neomegalonema sp.]|nr:aromatic ring-hydroxylating dioxygenase subunit alpha [Neomegalonema sp.]
MQGLTAELMRGHWYVAMPGAELKRSSFEPKTLLGEPVVIGRRADGSVFALKDHCPHRGIPLRYGRMIGDDVECCYHGWRFNGEGTCTLIPSLTSDQQVEIGKIRCGAYPCVEQQGMIWIFFGEKGEAPGSPPKMPYFDRAPDGYVTMPFECSTDHAAFGLMDPTHAAFVHTSWWFKKDATKLREKEKHFEPCELGWRMKRHKVPARNIAYRPIGKNIETQITYRLPGFRIEEIVSDTHQVVSVTVITPIDEGRTQITQYIWWSMGWAFVLKPLVRRLGRIFIEQDRDVVQQQREGLVHKPRLMLINDADTQARWWMRLKDEWFAHRAEDRPFANPLREQTLRWRS